MSIPTFLNSDNIENTILSISDIHNASSNDTDLTYYNIKMISTSIINKDYDDVYTYLLTFVQQDSNDIETCLLYTSDAADE